MSARVRHLFTCWNEVSARLRAASSVALFLDFDGTLAPLQPRPEGVYPNAAVRRAVARLAHDRRFRVWIISGRRRADVRGRIALAGIEYLGLHGWEGPERAALQEDTRERLVQVKEQVLRLIGNAPAAWMEDKGMVVTVHHAGASQSCIRRMRAELARFLDQLGGGFRLMPGDRSTEIMPLEVKDKGVAVRRQWQKVVRKALPVFVGDDAVDEPAFAALAEGITVRVGRAAATRAHYRLGNVAEVRIFLERLASEAT